MNRASSFYDALPAYPGGKRRLVPQILRHVPDAPQAPVIADPFAGGGAVSLALKARGHRLLANDVAERSYLGLRALIQNDRRTISGDDRTRLLAPRRVDPFVETNFAGEIITVRHARAVDRMLANLDRFEGLKRDLMKFVIVKFLLALMPFNQFSASGSFWRPLSAGDFDGIRDPYHVHVKTALLSPATLFRRVAEVVNRGVFGNGQENRAYQMDVFEFLEEHRNIDVLYLDPPYAGTLAYEKEFARLDQILALDLCATLPVSAFSQSGALRQVERIFERTPNVPLTILSYGNAEASLEELVAVVRRHRSQVEAHEIRYRHMANRSSKEKNAANREYLVVARR